MKRRMLATTGSVCLGPVAAVVLWAGMAGAVDPPVKCEAQKNKTAGKYASCRQKAEGKLVMKGDATKYGEAITKCDTKFGHAWDKWELKASEAGSACPTMGDKADMQNFLALHTGTVALALSGAGLSVCGNGAIEGGEACDIGDMNGETCTSQLGVEAVGTLGCAAGCGAFDTSGCVARFVDNLNGTITDNLTKLMWEKKDNNNTGGIHDQDRTGNWSANINGTVPDGTAFTDFLATLNDAGGGSCASGGPTGGCCPNDACTDPNCFASHCDWRLPTLEELQTIVDSGASNPATYPAFNTGCAPGCTVTTCSCTWSGFYYSASSDASSPDLAWGVFFSDGSVDNDYKWFGTQWLRAVRSSP